MPLARGYNSDGDPVVFNWGVLTFNFGDFIVADDEMGLLNVDIAVPCGSQESSLISSYAPPSEPSSWNPLYRCYRFTYWTASDCSGDPRSVDYFCATDEIIYDAYPDMRDHLGECVAQTDGGSAKLECLSDYQAEDACTTTCAASAESESSTESDGSGESGGSSEVSGGGGGESSGGGITDSSVGSSESSESSEYGISSSSASSSLASGVPCYTCNSGTTPAAYLMTWEDSSETVLLTQQVDSPCQFNGVLLNGFIVQIECGTDGTLSVNSYIVNPYGLWPDGNCMATQNFYPEMYGSSFGTITLIAL